MAMGEPAGYLHVSDRPLAAAFDAALLDLDGVVYRGPDAVAGAVEAIAAARRAGMRMAFVTNNANREPATVAAHLTSLGVPAEESEVVTAAQAAAALLAQELPAGARVLPVGGPGLRTALKERGFQLVADARDVPAAVVQGFSPKVGWSDLAEATYAIRAGARYLATNLDLTIPTERGIAPGNGTLVGVVRTATGVEPGAAGKPGPRIFHQAAERVGSRRPMVIGDRLDTDLAGAVAAGMPGLLVLTGVSDARDAVLAVPAERPAFISRDLGGLLEPHAPTRREPAGWVCGGASARVVGGRLEVREPGAQPVEVVQTAAELEISLDALRAACCAAWEAADGGLAVAQLPRLRVARVPKLG